MLTYRAPTRIQPGAVVAVHQFDTVSGAPVRVPDPDRLTHLQFRRFAGCPVCDLHLRSFVRRHDEIVRAEIREIVVFHSSAEELKVHASGLPFAVIPDPHKDLYLEFGVEASIRGMLDPRAWGAIIRGVLLRLWEIILARKSAPALHIPGG